jgi:hypothetical protein
MASIWQVVLRLLGVRHGEMLAIFLLQKKRLIPRHPYRRNQWKVPTPPSRHFAYCSRNSLATLTRTLAHSRRVLVAKSPLRPCIGV